MTNALFDAYRSGTLAAPAARAFEDRVAADATLRAEVTEAAAISADRLALRLDVVLAATIAPPPSRFERAAQRIGVPERIARVLAATPALRVAWCAAVFVVLVVAASAGDATDKSPHRLAPFLALAPIVSVLGVALSYGPFADRAHEVLGTTPLAGIRLLLLRTAAVLVAAFTVSGLAALLAPSKGLIQLAWLLPTIALVAATLALSTRVSVQAAASIVGAAWLVIVIVAGQVTNNAVATFGAAGQIACAGVAMITAIALVIRRNTNSVRSVE
jgi:hypothetical protein